MATKKPARAPVAPTAERIAAAVGKGDCAGAAALARELHAIAPTPENRAGWRKVVQHAATFFADHGKFADFNRMMAEAASIDPDDAAWAAERAALLVRGGRLSDALALADAQPDAAAIRLKVFGHLVDRALRNQDKSDLPEELQPGYDAVVAAFRHHEAGHESEARDALESIGLRSPFLEWKLLVRGLLAHAAGDDARAAENWSRLDAARVPARLAAPLRVAADPAYKASISAPLAEVLLQQHAKLTAGPVVSGLRAIARELGGDKPLTPALRVAESVVPTLKQTTPHLIPQLANCFYHAIRRQGQPDDLSRFRKLFGEPPHDPHFHKLTAGILEQVGDRAAAHDHWKKFEAWLAANPPGWPPALANRVRAAVWLRMGANAEAALGDDEKDDGLGFDFFVRIKPKKAKPLQPSALDCFRKSAALAPDWSAAAKSLFEKLVAEAKPAEAEAAARTFLTHRPNDIEALSALTGLLQTEGRAEEASEIAKRALAVNPLDKTVRRKTALMILAAARREMIAGSPVPAVARINAEMTLLEQEAPSGALSLLSVLSVKLGKPEEAAELRAKALAIPVTRLGVAYRIMVDSQLAKLKPADKRAASQLYAEEMVKPPLPMEVASLLATHESYKLDAVKYVGQQSHLKKILDLIPRCLAADAPEAEFESLTDALVFKKEWKRIKKLADDCARRFPRNPFFPFVRCTAGLNLNERTYLLEDRARLAKRLAEASTEPRHQALLPRLDELHQLVASPFDMLDELFGPRH